MSSVLTKPMPGPTLAPPVRGTVGALVIGGDYQGLGIVRSLGRQGVHGLFHSVFHKSVENTNY